MIFRASAALFPRAVLFFAKKYAPDTVSSERGAKNGIRFWLRQDTCKAGLMQQAEQGICEQTLCS